MYVIYNGCYGGFVFSHEFSQELAKRLNKELDMCDDDYRTDQTACKLLLEKGSKWSSDSFGTTLLLCQIPTFMKAWIDIHDYDGMETIILLKSDYIVYKTRKMLENPTPEAIEELKAVIERVDSARIVGVCLDP